MENTPDRANIGEGGGASASKAEESPLYNFIDNLSPIKPVKSAYSAHNLQAFQSLNIISISSIFTSPHDNSQKEPKFPLGTSFPELSVNSVCPNNGEKGKLKLSSCTTISGETQKIRCSINEGPVDPLDDLSAQPSDTAPPAHFYAASPDHNIAPCHGGRLDPLVQIVCSVRDSVEKRKCLFASGFEVLNGHQAEGNEYQAVVDCDWEDNLLSGNAEGVLIFDSSTGEDQRGVQLSDNKAEPSRDMCVEHRENGESSSTQIYLDGLDETGHTPNLFPNSQNNVTSSDPINACLAIGNDCAPLGYKAETQQQRGIRRRCLNFEASGYSVEGDTMQDLLSSQDRLNTGKTPSPRVPRGIGLHLNALSLKPTNKMDIQDPLVTGKQLTNISCSSSLIATSTTRQDSQGNLLSTSMDSVPISMDLQEPPVDDNCALAMVLENDQVSCPSSPKKKRPKLDNEDGDACKRCSCKKSKCLKLYCECFAAGVYCCEPCSCLACFNKPSNEEMVLATRKQIEFRNPLAFAPKVIRASDTGQEIGEVSNNTPASSRHKRGCNCKKSNCLKRYCECYQGGVGCSNNCRCESCKNTFGRRDGSMTTEAEEIKQVGEGAEVCVEEDESNQQKANVQIHENRSLRHVPITPPFEACRSLAKLSSLSSAKPPRPSKARAGHSSRPCAPQALLESETALLGKHSKAVYTGFGDDTPDMLRDSASPGNCIKTTSPNGKRVSPPHGHGAVSISPSRKGGRKLILKSIPSFPSLLDAYNECPTNNTNSSLNSSELT